MMPRTPASLSTTLRSIARTSRQKARDEESEIESTALPAARVEETIEPPESYQCNDKCSRNACKDGLIWADGGATIKIIVGVPPDRKTFVMHKSVLCRDSAYFAVALGDGRENIFIEAERGVFEWPDDEPEQVQRWMRWLYSCGTCRAIDAYNSNHVCKRDGRLGRDPHSWCHPDVEAEQAFLLGDRILCADYCRFALASFVQHVHAVDLHRIVWTLESLPAATSLRRFALAWLGWMKFKLDKRLDMPPQEEGLASAYSTVFARIDGWRTSDPRKFVIDHWSQPCSASAQQCEHKRAAWYWRHTPDGKPGTEPRIVVPDISPARRMVCRGSVWLWYLCCVTMLVLSAYVIAKDRVGLIARSSKVLGVIVSTFAFVGMCFVGSWLRTVSRVTTLMAFATATFSSVQAARCFKTAPAGTSICRLQTGFASVEMIYTLVLSAIVFSMDRYDGGYFST